MEGSARLATGTVAEEVARVRAEGGEGDIAVGGATLAAEAAAAGLIDEYRPVRQERRVDLELLETRVFSSAVTSLRYRVVR